MIRRVSIVSINQCIQLRTVLPQQCMPLLCRGSEDDDEEEEEEEEDNDDDDEERATLHTKTTSSCSPYSISRPRSVSDL